jgi:DNA-binding FadR family transcriptional regulator
MPSDQLLRRVKKVRISDTVVDQIVVLIEEGKLKVGDQLPSERELVIQLDVGRASVREALRILEAQGVIEVKPGKGIYITGDVTRLSGVEGIKRWFREHADEIGTS